MFFSMPRPLTNRLTIALATAFGFVVLVPLQQVQAQQEEVFGEVLEEVVVTARQREESLKDVPVAISVITDDFIREAGIRDQFDLFQLTPGLNYNEARDRNGATPGIRGIQAQNQNALRQKVSIFMDGMPILANIGAMTYAGLERVEVLRGPQSTAFGRATFGGAINYVTADPGDTFSSAINVGTSDQGRNTLGVSFDGPINDSLGYMFNVYTDSYDGPDEWKSTDGYKLGSQSTDLISGKLKFAPNDRFDMEVSVFSMSTADGPPAEVWLSEAERDACMNMKLPNGRPYLRGDFDCDTRSGTPPGGIPMNHDTTVGIDKAADPLLYWWAKGYASVQDPGSTMHRDRIQAEFNFHTEGGSTLQVLTSYSEEDAFRWFDNDRSNLAPKIASVTMMGRTSTSLVNVSTMAGPRTNEEKFVDVRWLSPADQSVRWLVGASVFEYTSVSAQWFGYAGYSMGLEDEFEAAWKADSRTANTPFSTDPWRYRARDNESVSNLGIYASVQWDITDQTTLSAEIRQADDDNIARGSGDTKFEFVNSSTQPRLSITHALSDNWTAYGQYATGSNPAGANLPLTDERMKASLTAANKAGHVTYDASTYLTFDEEEITNFEVGIKGAGLDNRLQLSAALYTMDWDNIIQGANFTWNGDWNDGTYDPDGTIFTIVGSGMVFVNSGVGDVKGVEVEGSYRINDNWSLRGGATIASNVYDTFCERPDSVDDFGYTPTHTVAADGVLYDCVNLDGKKITAGPEKTMSLSTTYRAPLGGTGWEWSVRGGVRAESQVYMDAMNIMTIPNVMELNGSVNFTNDNWEITLFGNNLTDLRTPRPTLGLGDDPNICGFLSGCKEDNFLFRLRTPREMGVRLRYQF